MKRSSSVLAASVAALVAIGCAEQSDRPRVSSPSLWIEAGSSIVQERDDQPIRERAGDFNDYILQAMTEPIAMVTTVPADQTAAS